MKKILMFSRDPGGCNVVASTYIAISDIGVFNIDLYGKEFALERYAYFGLTGKALEVECYSELKLFIGNGGYEIIITGTSADDFTERWLWKIGSELGIYTIAILDQWVNYGIRFSNYCVDKLEQYKCDGALNFIPNEVWAMDEYAKRKLMDEGFSSEMIRVVGQPYFNYIQIKYSSEKSRVSDAKKRILFASEPLTETYTLNNLKSSELGYTEMSIFQVVYRILVKLKKECGFEFSVVIRKHPKELPNKFTEYLMEGELEIELDDEVDGVMSILNSDIVIGMSSVFLLECLLLSKEIISVQIGLKVDSPFFLDAEGVVSSIMNEYDLEKQIIDIFENKVDEIRFSPILDSFQRIRKRIESL